MTAPRLLRIPEAAARLGCCREHVYNLINACRIDATDIGLGRSQTRISEAALDAYITAQTTKARRSA